MTIKHLLKLYAVGNYTQFGHFLRWRKRDDTHQGMLWNCFYYHATYPFPEYKFVGDVEVDLEGFIQAVTLLAADGLANAGRNRTALEWSASQRDPLSIKARHWERFRSISFLATRDHITNYEHWQAPQHADTIVEVVRSQLPIPRMMTVPPAADVERRIKRLLESQKCPQVSANDMVVMYNAMVSLLSTMLQVATYATPDGSGEGDPQFHITARSNTEEECGVAEGILLRLGFKLGASISFADYVAISERLVRIARRCTPK